MEYKSKTQKKKEALFLQELGEKLMKFSSEQLNNIDLPYEVRDAVDRAKSIKSHGGLRRQMQYIGTLMRKIDAGPVREAIHDIENAQHKQVMIFKELERWRDELINGNDELIEEILERHPDADRRQLTQLVRNARKETVSNKPPKASRLLFNYLKKIRTV